MFKLEITTMREFLLFISLIKTQEIEQIKEMTKELNESSDKLKEAIDKQA